MKKLGVFASSWLFKPSIEWREFRNMFEYRLAADGPGGANVDDMVVVVAARL